MPARWKPSRAARKKQAAAPIGITANFFKARANQFIDEEIRKKTWQGRLFALIARGDAFVACPGGTGTLVELSVVWEMLNKHVVSGKPLVVLGDFWHPIIDRVREIELGHETRWGEKQESLIHRAASPTDAAVFLAEYFRKAKITRPRPGNERARTPLFVRLQLYSYAEKVMRVSSRAERGIAFRSNSSSSVTVAWLWAPCFPTANQATIFCSTNHRCEVFVSRSAQEVLEFDRLKEIVSGYTTCAPGRRAIEALAPQQDVAALGAEFTLINEAVAYFRAGSELGFGSLADPETWLARLAVPASVLAIGELLDATSLMELVNAVRQTFKEEAAKHPQLSARAAALADLRHLTTAIRRAILPNGEISDDASPQLRRIRTGIAQGRDKIRRSLESILRSRGETTGEDYVTLRNDRFVIPVRASERRNVPGVVHAASSTGQTVFVEPLEAIDLNNRLVQLSDEELVEISRILSGTHRAPSRRPRPAQRRRRANRASRFYFRPRSLRA